MEADSTTRDNSKDGFPESKLPFTSLSGNLMFYNELTSNKGEKSFDVQIVGRLQGIGLIPKKVKCPTDEPGCELDKKTARVIDKIQWACKSCGKRLPIRTGTFFLRIQCSILQTLQIILAWCEDADYEIVAQHFGVKPKGASLIYDKLDEIAVKEMNKSQLGGEGSVVLAEMYPDCLTRLSPDTTDQPHLHRILMIADTKHVPTRYHLHVIKEGSDKNSNTNSPALKSEIEEVLSEKVSEGSCIVTGNHVPTLEGASSIQQLVQHCDADIDDPNMAASDHSLLGSINDFDSCKKYVLFERQYFNIISHKPPRGHAHRDKPRPFPRFLTLRPRSSEVSTHCAV
ncbi:hypothetical protein NE865_14536 [Phthorimaea operculella]|nr:hypothetical protein NE865_14536 [Phthorimaea operculella]